MRCNQAFTANLRAFSDQNSVQIRFDLLNSRYEKAFDPCLPCDDTGICGCFRPEWSGCRVFLHRHARPAGRTWGNDLPDRWWAGLYGAMRYVAKYADVAGNRPRVLFICLSARAFTDRAFAAPSIANRPEGRRWCPSRKRSFRGARILPVSTARLRLQP